MNDYPTLQTVSESVSNAANALFGLLDVMVIVLGLTLLLLSLKRLRDYGLQRQRLLGNTLPLAVIGFVLLFLAQTIKLSNQTLYQTADIWLYAINADDWSSYVVMAVIQIIRLIGLIGLVRGLNLLRYTGHESQLSVGAVSRGLVFIVAGIAAINILLTTQVVVGTLGLESPLVP